MPVKSSLLPGGICATGSITPENFTEWTRRATPQAHDVILSRRCNPGETAFVPPGLKCALGQNLVLLRADGRTVLPPFLRWLVRGKAWWEEVGGFINVGAVFDSLKCADIPRFRLPIPSLPEQRAIAAILGSLDDKIELNRRMNETLEAMARAIFKSWFVDFDPVRRNMAKKRGDKLPPSAAAFAETDALFPAAFQDSPLGKIPKGWKVGTIGDAVEVIGGSTPSTKEAAFWAGGTIPFATPKDLSALQGTVLLDTERYITPEGLTKISSGLLPQGTVLLSSRAPIGYLAIAEVPVAINQGFIAMKCCRSLPNQYVLRWTQENMPTIIGSANGTTFLEISKRNFRPIALVLPTRQVLDAFVALVVPLHQRVAVNLRASGSLALVRNVLLAKLLSGQIRVTEVLGVREADG